MAGIEPTLPTATQAYKPLHMGGTQVNELHLGGSQISKAYLGSDLVYQLEDEAKYFKIVNTSNQYGTITLTKSSSAPNIKLKTYSSNTDNWTDWGTISATTTFNLPEGTYMLFDGRENAAISSGTGAYWRISCNVPHDVEGDIMTLISGDTVGTYGFKALFSGDTQLENASGLTLPSTVDSYCYQSMFNGCTSLTTVPKLPATTLAYYCYEAMFRGCTSLTTAPELPATTLANSCYSSMFKGCTSLTSAPVLPATALTSNCYYQMFQGCTSLTTAPELPATTLATFCYMSMFSGCTSLNSITCLATDKSANSCTSNWVIGVSEIGNFICPAAMESVWYFSVNGIPETWAINGKNYLRFFNNSTNAATLTLTKDNTPADTTIKVSTNGQTWTTSTITSTTTFTIPALGKLFIDGLGNWSSTDGAYSFSCDKSYKVTGDIMRLVSGDTIGSFMFQQLFYGDTKLTDAHLLILPNSVASGCYSEMFKGCTSLTKGPVLPAQTLAGNCYYALYNGCTSLNEITCLSLENGSGTKTSQWVANVAASGTFYCDPTMTNTWTTGNNGVPSGWTIQAYSA